MNSWSTTKYSAIGKKYELYNCSLFGLPPSSPPTPTYDAHDRSYDQDPLPTPQTLPERPECLLQHPSYTQTYPRFGTRQSLAWPFLCCWSGR
jgi:hypothetical protein